MKTLREPNKKPEKYICECAKCGLITEADEIEILNRANYFTNSDKYYFTNSDKYYCTDCPKCNTEYLLCHKENSKEADKILKGLK